MRKRQEHPTFTIVALLSVFLIIGAIGILNDTDGKGYLTGFTVGASDTNENLTVVVEDAVTDVVVNYETPAPYILEEKLEEPGRITKNVEVVSDASIHYENVIAFTELPNVDAKNVKIFWLTDDLTEELEVTETEIPVTESKEDLTETTTTTTTLEKEKVIITEPGIVEVPVNETNLTETDLVEEMPSTTTTLEEPSTTTSTTLEPTTTTTLETELVPLLITGQGVRDPSGSISNAFKKVFDTNKPTGNYVEEIEDGETNKISSAISGIAVDLLKQETKTERDPSSTISGIAKELFFNKGLNPTGKFSEETETKQEIIENPNEEILNELELSMNLVDLENVEKFARIDVTSDAVFLDTDNDGLVDAVYWVVPKLSNQSYEIEISLNVITLQSYPTVGGNWTVEFNTTGVANLTITPVNGTSFTEVENDNQTTEDDLTFLELYCGENLLQHQYILSNGSTVDSNFGTNNSLRINSAFYPNYNCTQNGFETSKVLTPGFHELQFKFGNIIDYARNTAGDDICDEGNANSSCNLTATHAIDPNSTLNFVDIIIKNGGSIEGTNFTINASNLIIQNGGKIKGTIENGTHINITAANITIDVGAEITLYAAGFGGGKVSGIGIGNGTGPEGPSAPSSGGGISGWNVGGGGAGGSGGQGGAGGNTLGVSGGGNKTGNETTPLYAGSGGGFGSSGSGNAGDGGGAIFLNATQIFEHNGTIAANASQGVDGGQYPPGGGSGGSIYIYALTITGNGTLDASGGDGGAGSTNNGGGGSGGRIAVHYETNTTAAYTTTVTGGQGDGGGTPPAIDGEAGTVNYFTFSTNTAPTVPEPHGPSNNSLISSLKELNWTNSSDADGDSITYGFELSSDSNFGSFNYTNYTITETDNVTEIIDAVMPTNGSASTIQKISETEGGGPNIDSGAQFGTSAVNMGDLDGDGIQDIAVGIPLEDDTAIDGGAVDIIFLNNTGGVKNRQRISETEGGGPDLDNSDQFGKSVANIGDVNADGITDLAVGAYLDDDGEATDNEGAVYVLFLNESGWANVTQETQKISELDGGGPNVDNDDYFGASVAGIGDINADGTPDIAVGAYGDDDGASGAGAIYIVFLNASGWANVTQQTQKISETNGSGPNLDTNDNLGYSVTSLGDLDGDGTPDITVGAYKDGDGASQAGAVYTFFLNASGWATTTQKISETSGGGPNLDANDWFGRSVANLGDIDGDGIVDLGVGAVQDDDGTEANDGGAVYLLNLNRDGTVKNTHKISEITGHGLDFDTDDYFGSSIASTGDVNGDGTKDIVVGARLDDDGEANNGAIYNLFLTPRNGTYFWRVFATDGNSNSSNSKIFQFDTDLTSNTAPTLSALAINTTDPTVNNSIQNLTVSFVPTDANAGDTLTCDIEWMKNNVTQTDNTLSDVSCTTDEIHVFTLHSGNTSKNDTWLAAVRVYDATEYSDWTNTTPIFINNTKPTPPTPHGPANNSLINSLKEINWTNSTDNDGDAITYGFELSSDSSFGSYNYTNYTISETDNVTEIINPILPGKGDVKSIQKISELEGNGPDLGGDQFGMSATSLGDINGDGIVDIAVGAYGDDDGGTNRGAVYILFLYENGTVNTTQKISQLEGGGPNLDNSDFFGWSVANIGDLNGDGINDIAVGAYLDDDGPEANDGGAVYILFLNNTGGANTTQETQKISETSGGGPDFDADDNFGFSVGGTGDINGDGIVDLAVGANGDDDGGTNRGAVYILFLNASGYANITQETQKISTSTGGGPSLADGDFFGASVTGIGDLNNDGTRDIVAGANLGDDGGSGAGEVHILFLNASGWATSTQKISATTGGGPSLTGSDWFGTSVANIGDLNGDGINDIAVGAYDHNDGITNVGAVWILFLDTDGTASRTQEISQVAGGGPTLDQADQFGRSVAGIGDINDDGVTDIVVGAGLDDDGQSGNGAVYILNLKPIDSTYYWQVFATDNVTNSSNSSTYQFTYDATPPNISYAPETPANDTSLNESWLYINWTIDNEPNNLDTIIVTIINSTSVINHTEYTSLTLEYNTSLPRVGIYLFNISANDTLGNTKTELTRTYNNKIIPDTPPLNEPINNSVINTISELNWSNVTDTGGDPITYGIQISNTTDFDHTIYVNNTITETTNTTEDIFAGTALIRTVKNQTKISETTGGGPNLDSSDQWGYSIANIGDINGDGINDLAVGAYLDDDGTTNTGAIYILFMFENGTVNTTQKISPTQGGGPNLDNSDYFGTSIANIGDLNADGIPDLAVGAYNDDDGASNAGAVYILFLNNTGGANTTQETQKISETSGGGPDLDASDFFGRSVANIGDLNADGINDIAVGAYQDDDGASGTGAVYIFTLNASGWATTTQKISNNSIGLDKTALDANDQFGYSVADIGDQNNDGINDIIVGAPADDDGTSSAGAIYILNLLPTATIEDATYYWKTYSTNNYFNSTNSETRAFTYDATQPVPTFDSETPTNNTLILGGWLYINWTITETNLDTITITIENGTDIINHTEYTTLTLEYNTSITDGQTYHYNISANDTAGNQNTTELRTIRTNTKPTTPTLNEPLNNTAWLFTPLEFNWSNSTDGDGDNISYGLEISDQSDFSTFNYTSYDIAETANTTSDTGASLPNDAIYYWRVFATDGTSNSSNSVTYEFYIDNAAPTISFDSEAPSNNTYLTDSTLYFNWTITETKIDTITVVLVNGTGDASTINFTESNTLSEEFNTSLPDGTYLFNVSVNDTQGNLAVTDLRNVTIDTAIPALEFDSQTLANNTHSSDEWLYINWTLTENNINTVTIVIENGTDIINHSEFTNALTEYNTSMILRDNHTYHFNVTVVDAVDNLNVTELRTIIIDALGPEITFSAETPNDQIYLNSPTLYFNWTVTDSNLDTIGIAILNDTNLVNESFFTTLQETYNITLGEGPYTYNVSANDTLGNAVSGGVRNITLDSVIPLLVFGSETEINNSITQSPTLYINWTITENNLDTVVVTVKNDSEIVNETSFTTDPGEINISLLSGVFHYNVSVNDSAGNTNVTKLRIFTTDRVAPNFNSSNHSIVESGEDLIFTLRPYDDTFTDAVTLEVAYPNRSWINFTMTNSSSNFFQYNISAAPVGDYDFTYYLSDQFGYNSTHANFTEVYRLQNVSGQVKDSLNRSVNATFEFFKPNTTRKLANLSADPVTGLFELTNKELHNRTYDLLVKIFNKQHRIFWENVTIAETTNNITTIFEELNDTDVTDSFDLSEPRLGIAVNFTLPGAGGNLTLNYSDIKNNINESKLEIYKCSTWDFNARSCSSGWINQSSTETFNLTDEIQTPVTSFSSYIITENMCGNNSCDAQIGEDQNTCAVDCGTTIIVTTTTTLPPAGGGGLNEDELNELLRVLRIINGIQVDTNELYFNIAQGATQKRLILFKNIDDYEKEITILLPKELKELMSVDRTTRSLPPGEVTDIELVLAVPDDLEPQIIKSKIVILSGGQSEVLPVTIELLPQSKVLTVQTKPLKSKVEPGENLRVKTKIVHNLDDRIVNVTLKFSLEEKETGEIVTETEKVLILAKEIETLEEIKTQKSDPVGEYILRTDVSYAHNPDVKTFSLNTVFIRRSFLNFKIFGVRVYVLLLFLINIVILAGGVILIYKITGKKRTYPFAKLNKLPKTGLHIGNVSRKNRKTFLDYKQLNMHTIVSGSSGSGKTIAAQDIVEEALNEGTSVIVFDPTAQWTGFLKKCEDKKMKDLYSKFGMKKSSAKGYKGTIKFIQNPQEILNLDSIMKQEGQIGIYVVNQLDHEQLDTMVASTIQQIFDANLEESRDMKLMIVYDEVHRLLPKFGGTGKGFVQLERAAREFRKWGIGLIMISQILGDFVEEIHANISTEIQMRTKHNTDLKRTKAKYGPNMLRHLNTIRTGTAMIQNSQANEGEPYFVDFRPILHNTTRLNDKQLETYSKYQERIDALDYQIQQLKDLGKDPFDFEIEVNLAKEKLAQGRFKLVRIYLEGIEPNVKAFWKKIGKRPKTRRKQYISEKHLSKQITIAQEQRKEREKKRKEKALKEKTILKDAKNKKRGGENGKTPPR